LVALYFLSQFISNSDPIVAKIVLTAKDLQVPSIGDEFLNELIQLLGLLTLSSTF